MGLRNPLHELNSSINMKTLSIVALLLLAFSGRLLAGESSLPHKSSAEFEQMKTLVGTWKGQADMGQGSGEITIEYRLISGGSAIEERVFAGTPHEMVTMYHDKQGKLGLTHYCSLGNCPEMVVKSSEAKTLKFDFDPKCGVKAKSEMHMHSLAITFDGPDAITQEWILFADGKAKGAHPFVLKRVKA
ncbi:MAG: hypothetical protein JWR26_3937 [Pedosphaera sp.]|nr:hypothetical protein [Pedosphaera sp.]